MSYSSMNRFLFTIVLLFFGYFLLANKNEETVFVHKNGQVNSLILRLLELTGVEHDGTLPSIVTATQAQWLRKPGSERWDIQKTTASYQQELYEICNKLRMFQEIDPAYPKYEHAFVLGAIFDRMKVRFQFLIDQWNKGVRFNNIVLLAGSRAANKEQGENQENLEQWAQVKIEKMPETETELLKFIYDHIQMPEDMRKIPVQIIDVPMQKKADGTFTRPTTADTIQAWIATNPQAGKILAVSSQPYVGYQDSVMQTLIPDSFDVDTVGQACCADQKIGLLLDTLARILYQEKMRVSL